MQLTPYIIFKGSCEEALNFYAGALGGAIGQISRYGDIPGGDTHGEVQLTLRAIGWPYR